MNPVSPARRHAEEFATLVDRPRRASEEARYADLLDVVEQVRTVTPPQPRNEHVSSLREALMAEADRVLLTQDPRVEERLRLPASPVGRPNRRLAAATGAIALVGASASMAVAAQTALPGDTLYPVKRALEEARTGISVDEADKGSVLLANASDRLAEATELAGSGDARRIEAVRQALATFTEQSESGAASLLESYSETGDQAALERVREFTATSMQHLAVLRAMLPANPAGTTERSSGTSELLLTAARTLREIDAIAAELCPACGGTITEVPGVLLSAGRGDEATMVSPVREQRPEQQRGTGTGPRGAGSTGQAPTGQATGSPNGKERGAIDLPDLGDPIGVGAGGGSPDATRNPNGSSGSAEQGPLESTVGTTLETLTDGLTSGLTEGLRGLTGDRAGRDGGQGQAGDKNRDRDKQGLVGGLTDGVEDTVDGVTGTVDDTLGGLLGGGSSNPDSGS